MEQTKTMIVTFNLNVFFHNVPKQDALPEFLFKFDFAHGNTKAHENKEGIQLSGRHKLLVYVYVNIFDRTYILYGKHSS
jgi:hypothetical protein